FAYYSSYSIFSAAHMNLSIKSVQLYTKLEKNLSR
mgnify:CR=1